MDPDVTMKVRDFIKSNLTQDTVFEDDQPQSGNSSFDGGATDSSASDRTDTQDYDLGPD